MLTQPKYYAFFDVDGTIIKTNTMFSFLKFWYEKKSFCFGKSKYLIYEFFTYLYEKAGVSREYLNKRYYKKFKGSEINEVSCLGKQWYEEEFTHQKLKFQSETINEIKHHQSRGAEVVFVSGSFMPCLEDLANYLNVNFIIATSLEIKNGFYTGRVLEQTIGNGKALSIKKFLAQKNYSNVESCYAYGDHRSDIEMLSLVGHACVIDNDEVLLRKAEIMDWRIINNKRENCER